MFGAMPGAVAAAAPSLTLKLTSVDDVKVSWAFDALATRSGSVLEVQRSTNDGAFVLVKKLYVRETLGEATPVPGEPTSETGRLPSK